MRIIRMPSRYGISQSLTVSFNMSDDDEWWYQLDYGFQQYPVAYVYYCGEFYSWTDRVI